MSLYEYNHETGETLWAEGPEPLNTGLLVSAWRGLAEASGQAQSGNMYAAHTLVALGNVAHMVRDLEETQGQLVRRAKREGHTPAEIAAATGISRQKISAILRSGHLPLM